MFYVYPLIVNTLMYLHCPVIIDNTMINIPLDLYDAFFEICIQEFEFWILGHLCTYFWKDCQTVLQQAAMVCTPAGSSRASKSL